MHHYKLTGSQYKQLAEALLDAFPSQQKLTELVQYQFDKNLNVIAIGSDLKEIVFKLIQTAEAEGWTDKLIAGARASNAHNSKLFAFAQEYNPKSKICVNEVKKFEQFEFDVITVNRKGE